jgi:hypothetical protein
MPYTEDGGSNFLRNFGIFDRYTVQKPKKEDRPLMEKPQSKPDNGLQSKNSLQRHY